MKNEKGFMASTLLYPLFLVFLALLLKIFIMSDTRKKILDQMKNDISSMMIEDSDCRCDTLLQEKKYWIDESSYAGHYSYHIDDMEIKGYETPYMIPASARKDTIAVITDFEVGKGYVSQLEPVSPHEGDIWIVQNRNDGYELTEEYITLGVCYVKQYLNGKWIQKKAYIYNGSYWKVI